MDTAFFYFFALLVLGGAILTITRRSAIHSAICLIVSLVGVAGLYLLQKAEFLFAVQIILYVGGIMVLFVFVIMLVNLDVAAHQPQFNRQTWVASLTALIVSGQFVAAFYLSRKAGSGRALFGLPQAQATRLDPNTELIGLTLFKNYMLPFEIASILLLVAMIGAVVMAKRRV